MDMQSYKVGGSKRIPYLGMSDIFFEKSTIVIDEVGGLKWLVYGVKPTYFINDSSRFSREYVTHSWIGDTFRTCSILGLPTLCKVELAHYHYPSQFCPHARVVYISSLKCTLWIFEGRIGKGGGNRMVHFN